MVVMATDDPLPRAELTFLLGMSFQLVLSEFVSQLDERGYADLRPMHGLVFQALGRQGATSTELAERLGVTKQAVGQIVDDLESRGYLERTSHPAGGRRRLVVLTDKAVQHLAIAGAVLHGLETQIATAIGDTHLDELRTRLAMIIRTMAGDDIPPLRPIW
jgi:DNA-binding MarR family transcriptional regulator